MTPCKHAVEILAKLKAYYRILKAISRWPFQLCLGDYVQYRGARWIIGNGVCRPSWTLYEYGGPGYVEYVHESQFKKERTLRNLWHDLRFGYDFYRGYWFDIWVREALEKARAHKCGEDGNGSL